MGKGPVGKKHVIDQINLDEIKYDTTIMLIGPRESGKTTAAKAIIRRINHRFAYGVLFSKSAKVSGDWKGWFPSTHVFPQLDEEQLRLIIRQQERLKRISRREGKADFPRVLILMDDVIDSGTRFNKTLSEVFTNGRHYNITIITIMHYIMTLDPTMRTNCAHFFFFALPNLIPDIHEKYAKTAFTYEAFERVFKKCTVNQGAFVVNALGHRDPYHTRSVYKYFQVAHEMNPDEFHEPCRVGGESFWRWATKNRRGKKRDESSSDDDEDEDDEEEEEDDDGYGVRLVKRKRKRQPDPEPESDGEDEEEEEEVESQALKRRRARAGAR